jgi:hypothetical protein
MLVIFFCDANQTGALLKDIIQNGRLSLIFRVFHSLFEVKNVNTYLLAFTFGFIMGMFAKQPPK